MTDSPGEDRPPILPDFELLRPIGQGGFGTVWLVRNRATGQLRAVKLVKLGPPGPGDPASRELASLTRLQQHVPPGAEHLLAIQHVGLADEHLYYVMEPADDLSGRPAFDSPEYRPATLRNLLEGGPLPPADCRRFARQLLAGLASLHAAGMVHRDVKPSNCLLVGGRLKLADFGLLTRDEPLVSRLGTGAYMPPDGRMDARADVYAAGLVLYEMLTGQPAERFPHLGPAAAAIAADPAWAALNRLALRAAEPAAEDRFADARAMLAELAAAESREGRPRRWGLAGLTRLGPVALLVAIVAWGAFALWPARRVAVNFVTEPFEATIWLDGQPLTQPDESPYTTPCTVPNVPARSARLVFRRPGSPDLDAGQIDFRQTREVTARWPTAP